MLTTLKAIFQTYSSPPEIVAYGIGNFARSEIGSYQIALLLEIVEHYNFGSKIKVFDPKFKSWEIDWLTNRCGNNFFVPNENDMVRHKMKCGTPLFAYMPHCGRPMYNNILWSNWTSENIKNLVILGNSFEGFSLSDRSNELLYLRRSKEICRDNLLPEFEPCYNAFNHCSVIDFDIKKACETDFWSKFDSPPVYVDHATEIISE